MALSQGFLYSARIPMNSPMDVSGPQPRRLNCPHLQTCQFSELTRPAPALRKLYGDGGSVFIDQSRGEVIGCPEYWRFLNVTAIINSGLNLSNEVDVAPPVKGRLTLVEGHKTVCLQRRPPALPVSPANRLETCPGNCGDGSRDLPFLGTLFPCIFVPKVGVEPTRVSPHEFESCASACSATSAHMKYSGLAFYQSSDVGLIRSSMGIRFHCLPMPIGIPVPYSVS